MHNAFANAMDALTGPTPPDSALAAPITDALPVNGVAISTLGNFLGNETVSASDGISARLDELQFDLGEGPCWDAFRSMRPVLEPNVRRPSGAWPAFSDAIRHHDIGSIYAFPLFVGPLQLGAIDMYSVVPGALSDLHTRQSEAFASVVSRLILHRALDRASTDPDDVAMDSRFSRRTIHQATGMVLAQLDLPPDEARLVIQAHAFATGRSMQEIAEDIVSRRLNFSMKDTGIEESP